MAHQTSPASGNHDAVVTDTAHPTMSSSTGHAHHRSGVFAAFNRWRKSRIAVQVVVGISLFVDMMVYGIVVPILPVIIKEKLHGDEDLVGILFGSYALGLLIATPPIALLSDRYHERRLPMLLGLLGLSITTLTFAFAVDYWQLMIARILQGIAAGASWTVGLSLLTDVFPPEKLGTAMGPVMSCNHLGFLVGPPLGGVLFEYFGYSSSFYACATLALINFIIRLIVDESDLIRPSTSVVRQRSVVLTSSPKRASGYGSINSAEHGRHHQRSDSERSTNTTESTSLWTLLKGKPIVLNCLVIVVVGGIFAALEPTLPMHLTNRFHLTPGSIGAIFTALVVPNIFMASAAGYLSDKYGGKKVMWVGLVIMTVLTPMPSLPESIWLEVVVLVLYGAMNAIVLTPILPEMGNYVYKRGGGAFAQVYALFNLSYSFGILLGPVLGGFIIARASFFWEMLTFTGILVLLMLILWYFADSGEVYQVLETMPENDEYV